MAAKQSRSAEAMPYRSDVATSAIVFVGFRVSKRWSGWCWLRSGAAGRPVAGFAVTAFIVHVGWQVTGDLALRLMDSVDPTTSTPPARPPVCPDARPGRWMGRSPLLEFGVATDPDQPFAAVDTPAGRSSARCWTPSHAPGTCAAHRAAPPDVGGGT
jgi:hypothetical protein